MAHRCNFHNIVLPKAAGLSNLDYFPRSEILSRNDLPLECALEPKKACSTLCRHLARLSLRRQRAEAIKEFPVMTGRYHLQKDSIVGPGELGAKGICAVQQTACRRVA